MNEMDELEFYDYDIVVVGCGVAGSTASLSAMFEARKTDKKLSLLMVERSECENRGGNSRWTGAFLRMESENQIADNFVEDMLSFSGGKSDRSYIEKLAIMAPETIQWIKEFGINYKESKDSFITISKPRLIPDGGGIEIVDTLIARSESMGAQIVYKSTAWKLIMDKNGRVKGLWLRGSDGNSVKVRAKAVILCSGGFEGNHEMLTSYMGKGADNLRTISKGGLYNRGEGIRMAMDVGAKTSGQWDQFHAEPIDPRASFKVAEPSLMIHPYGILVDKAGRRFIDEGKGTVDETYESVARAIFALPDQIAYFISDSNFFKVPNIEKGIGSKIEPVQSDSLVELARQVGVLPDNLAKTVEAFNRNIIDGKFDPTALDHKRALNIEPPKSNWAMPIEKPPYIAYPVVCSIVFTFGGLGVDLQSRVLSQDDVPIPGLYAAGEITGLYHNKYPGATSVLRSITFGRIAGISAVDYVKKWI